LVMIKAYGLRIHSECIGMYADAKRYEMSGNAGKASEFYSRDLSNKAVNVHLIEPNRSIL
jgi:hypothetical protein